MKTEFLWRSGSKRRVLTGVTVLALAAGGAGEQVPPNGGPPFGPPPPPPLTPPEKRVTELPAPTFPAMRPVSPLAADAPMPAADPRDLQGTWFHHQALAFRMQRDMFGVLVPYNMDGAKVLERRVMSLKNGKPYINASAICPHPVRSGSAT